MTTRFMLITCTAILLPLSLQAQTANQDTNQCIQSNCTTQAQETKSCNQELAQCLSDRGDCSEILFICEGLSSDYKSCEANCRAITN